MVICIDVSERTKQELDSLVDLGTYRDYAEAISIAISNQLVLQRQVSKTGPVVIPTSVESQADNPPKPAKVEDVRKSRTWSKPSVPTLFSVRTPYNQLSGPAHFPDDVFANGQAVPVDRWTFGQHNKLLPAKASCRGLAALLSRVENGAGVLIPKATSDIAENAVGLGDYLRALDLKYGLNRDDAFSTAFPSSGSESEDKARLRYASQFVAAISKQGQLTGFLVDLKLINQVRGKSPKLVLTEAGWEFAKIPSSVLDVENGNERPPKLTDQEISFLLQHIATHVPAEDFAYRTVLDAVLHGADTPERLDKILREHLPVRGEKPFTDAFLSTQRSGAISRMNDLDLIHRTRNGIRVTYVVSPNGKQYLQKMLRSVAL